MTKKLRSSTILCIILWILLPGQLFATGYYFYVQLKDKKNSPYSVTNPLSYLSQRAIDRRNYYSISIDSTDFPVNPDYIHQIEEKGIHVHCTTKWLNGVTVLVRDTTVIQQLRLLPFVKSAQYTGLTNENQVAYTKQNVPLTNYNYGAADVQIEQLHGKILHQNGFLGNGIQIAVLDAGFNNVNANPVFVSLRNEGRILGTKDFVNPLSNIYAEHIHGAQVLSIMAAENNGVYVGTAPKASYFLIRTEAATGEYLCEPDFWISGIEYADSVGVDLATTSLGYRTFDDPKMDYTYSDLNGNTARISIAANMAYNKGILLLNSAGNDGDKAWRYISVPADAAGVITVGSVTKDNIYSTFSSIGPSSDGRVKPDLCAMGTASAIVSTSGTVTYGNGTSYATPILAGLTACFLQAAKVKMPGHTLDELRENLFENASDYLTPTPQKGYGIPNFETSYNSMIVTAEKIIQKKLYNRSAVKLLVNNDKQMIKVRLMNDSIFESGIARLYSITGVLLKTQKFTSRNFHMDVQNLKSGMYLLMIDKK